jgi:hypothetical protein
MMLKRLLKQLAAFALVINIFLLPPVLFIEYTLNPLFILSPISDSPIDLGLDPISDSPIVS